METLRYHITHEDYTSRGFVSIPTERFESFITRSGLFVEEHTLGRVEWSFEEILRDKYTKLEERNIRGICEIADIFFRHEAAVGENGAAIIAFTNEGYSETYEGGARAQGQYLFAGRIHRLLYTYFTTEQLARRL